jgi:hypothetical protein
MHLHTDIGHDPDDIIALSYLIGRGLEILQTVSVSPGYIEQVRIVDAIFKIYGSIRPQIFVSEIPKKEFTGSNKLNEIISLSTNDSFELIPEVVECDRALVIGPAKNLNLECREMFFQGGYSPNSVLPLEKFVGQTCIPSFNPNGARKEFIALRDSDKIGIKYYVGKNVCHGFKKGSLKLRLPKPIQSYYDHLSQDKKMHDVLAAMLFVNKTKGIWSQEYPEFVGNRMTTFPDKNREIYTLIGHIA